jgi:F-type H+-transporting ATPase subunit gamma
VQQYIYTEKLTELIQNLSATLEGDAGEFTTQREVKKVLVVAITSNRDFVELLIVM